MKKTTVILAGGEGSRMGGHKPLRQLAGATLLERALLFAERCGGPVALAVRSKDQLGACTARLIIDDSSIEGPLAGLAAGLAFAKHSEADAVLTIPADMPFLPNDLAAKLADAIGDRGAAVARSAGKLHPVCGLWSSAAADSMQAYLATGRRSLKGFAETIGYFAVDWPTEPFDPFFNINCPDELEAAERLLAG